MKKKYTRIVILGGYEYITTTKKFPFFKNRQHNHCLRPFIL